MLCTFTMWKIFQIVRKSELYSTDLACHQTMIDDQVFTFPELCALGGNSLSDPRTASGEKQQLITIRARLLVSLQLVHMLMVEEQ